MKCLKPLLGSGVMLLAAGLLLLSTTRVSAQPATSARKSARDHPDNSAKVEGAITAATPEEAVALFYELSKRGDPGWLDLLAKPIRSSLKESLEIGSGIVSAHRQLESALDKHLGKSKFAPELPFGGSEVKSFLENLSTPERMAEVGRGLQGSKVVKKVPVRNGFELTIATEYLRVRETFNDKGDLQKTTRLETQEDTLLAIMEQGSWKLSGGPETIKQLEESKVSIRALLDDYAAAIREVGDGKYKTREQVGRVMVRAYNDRVRWLGIAEVSPPSAGEAIVRIREKDLEVGVYLEDFLENGIEPWYGEIRRLGAYLKKVNDASDKPLAILLVPESGVPHDKLLAAVEAIFDAGSERIEFQMDKEAKAKLEKSFEGRFRILKSRPSLPERTTDKESGGELQEDL